MTRIPSPTAEQISSTAGPSPAKNESLPPIVSLRLAIVVVGIGFAIFLGALDVNITDEFHSSSLTYHCSVGQRVIPPLTSHSVDSLLTLSSLQLAWGRLYKSFPAKGTFLDALVVFEVGFLGCGACPISVDLIVGRAIAGMGVSGGFSGAMIIASYTIPLHLCPLMNSALAVLMGSTRALGPVSGVALIMKASWRWCFYINLPLGALCGLLIDLGAAIPQSSGTSSKSWTTKLRWFDWIRMLLWIPFTVCWSSFYSSGASSSPGTTRASSTIWGTIFEFLIGGSSQLRQHFLPIYFHAVQRKSALTSGTSTLPLLVAYTTSLILTGIATLAVDQYASIMHVGSAIASVDMGLRTSAVSTLTAHTHPEPVDRVPDPQRGSGKQHRQQADGMAALLKTLTGLGLVYALEIKCPSARRGRYLPMRNSEVKKD
ncbi:MFS general substrate transporter [Aspergillus sclerotioniger CBS 115572]|uniref:MFS general substrate transporter n=1 Tax=Aspergillus sclerotioniger CBS 115572 TaxID=1450535 RepID=A0A317VQ59_9EURO|nr:MFS general substrate transporter [Aspergillus sclerotioniger CBS 115572]PWY76496.1 MFS general substrate transporter [Aspergillus sclerotioniger CBS 115572]